MRYSSLLPTLALAVTSAACSTKDAASTDSASRDSTAATASMPDSSHAAMSGMAMTGNADQDFLRMMSDHHKGLIALAHMTMEGTQAVTVKALAKQMDAKQDKELDDMTTMLERDFKDAYAPKIMPEHQKMVDELKPKAGADYDRTFLHHVIMHHEEAVKMVDQYLPTAKSATIKAMAEKMKADQTKEIADLNQRLAKLGS